MTVDFARIKELLEDNPDQAAALARTRDTKPIADPPSISLGPICWRKWAWWTRWFWS